MRRCRFASAVALFLLGIALVGPAHASWCGGSPAWRALAGIALVQIASLEDKLGYFERLSAYRDLAVLDTETVSSKQLAALERLASLAKRHGAHGLMGTAYELEGKAWHIMSEHKGSLVRADVH